MTDQADQLTTCHPDTRKRVEEHLPMLRAAKVEADAFFGDRPSEERSQMIRDAADAVRQTFPGLDDLTLASICLYAAGLAMLELAEAPTVSSYSTFASHVDMATELAWELKGEL